MDWYNENKYISELIYKKLIGLASEAELTVIDEWLKADKRNIQLYNNILNKKELKEDFSFLEKVDSNKLWNKLGIKENKSVSKLPQFVKWAALFILLAGITSLFVLDFNKPKFESNNETISGIVPGSSKARLIVEDGRVFSLKDSQMALVSSKNEVSITKGDSTGLRYDASDNSLIEAHIHTLDIPAGGEYCVNLSDGTKIWLNSKSKLRYPNIFNGQKRVVDLIEGEAFFKVSKDRTKPFYVRVKNTIIRVTGTSFVVSAYKDDDNISTSLLEGGVDVSLKGDGNNILEKVSIVPGMKAVVKKNSIETQKVDVSKEIAWLKGRFVFESERLDEILKRMSRWYDFEVFYQNSEVKDIVFTLDMKKYEDVETFLNAMEKIGDVKFRMKNRTLIVSKK